jgi:hypothetical protein
MEKYKLTRKCKLGRIKKQKNDLGKKKNVGIRR